MGIKHAFTSAVPDTAGPSIVKPSNWNADHTIDGDVDFNGYAIVNAAGASGDLLALTDTPDTYTNLGNRGPAGAAVRVNDAQDGVQFKWSTSEYIDIRDYDATLTTNSEITTALQAAIDDYANHLCRVIRIPRFGNGVLFWDPGLNSFPSTVGSEVNIGWTLEFDCAQVKLKSQFQMRNGMTVRGVMSSAAANFLPQPFVLPLFTNEASVGANVPLIQGAGNTFLERIAASSTGSCAYGVFGTNLITIRDCIFSTAKNSDYAMDINECFWMTIERVSAQGAIAGVVGAIGFSNGTTDAGTSGGGTDCGLIRCKELRLGRQGIDISADLGPVGTRNMVFEDVICENMLQDRDLFTFRTAGGTAYVGDIKIVRCEIADALVPGTNYIMNVDSRAFGSVYDIYVEGRLPDELMRPTADPIEGFVINQEIPSTATFSFCQNIAALYAGTEAWAHGKRHTPTCIDTKLLTSPVGAPWTPGAPLGVLQNPADWTAVLGATITTGIRGPDGSTMAGRVSGGNGARCLDRTVALAVGDWIVGGVWMRTSGAQLNTRNVNIALSGTGTWHVNGSTSQTFNNLGVEDNTPSDGWRWFGVACKVTSVGTGDATLRFTLSGNGFSCDYFSPCAVLMPVGTIDDTWAITLARSLKGGWGSDGASGDVVFPSQQNVMVKGNYVALQGRKTYWVPASKMTPRTTSGAQATTREINGITLPVLAFDTAADEGANFTIDFPNSWDRRPIRFQPVWTAASSSGTVEFELRGACFANDAPINVTGFGTAVASSDTLLATDDVHYSPESADVTLYGPPDENTLGVFEIIRDVSDDTLGADAELLGINVFYGTNAGEDTTVTHDGRVLQFIGYTADSSNLTTYTFSGASIGSPAADRLVVVVTHTGGTATALSSATIGGNAAAVVGSANNSDMTTAIFSLVVAAGTTADIVVTWDNACSHASIGVYAMYGLSSSAAADSYFFNADSSTTKRMLLDVPEGGMIVAGGATTQAADSWTWSGLTETYDTAVGGIDANSGAYSKGPMRERYQYPIIAVGSQGNDTCAVAAVWA
jgi:hypothetical protein